MKIVTETKLGVRKRKMLVPTSNDLRNDHARTPPHQN